jgi:hypothetical protein
MQFEGGQIVAGFLILRDVNGQRHGLRSVNGIHESDDGRTLLTVPGGRIVVVDSDFDETLRHFEGLQSRPPARPR